jgi:hypothetical protein
MSFFVVYLMGNMTTWRIAAGISASLPIITALYVTQVGEHSDRKIHYSTKYVSSLNFSSKYVLPKIKLQTFESVKVFY